MIHADYEVYNRCEMDSDEITNEINRKLKYLIENGICSKINDVKYGEIGDGRLGILIIGES